MTSATEQSPIVAASKTLSATLKDQPWMSALRASAAELAGRLPLPDGHRERPWKYLDVSGLDFAPYAPGPRPAPGATALDFGVAETATGVLLQKNGTTIKATGTTGVRVTDFADADRAAASTIEKHLSKSVPAGRSKFTALHYAYLAGGVLIQAAANAETPAPIRLVRSYDAAGQLACPHTLIVTGANSHITVIEDLRSNNEDLLVLPAVEVVPGAGSTVRYAVLHRWGAHTRVFSEQQVVTAQDSAFVGFYLVTGGQVVKSHLHSSLEGRGSSSELFGLYVGRDHQHTDFYTVQDHVGPDTRSDLLFKSALRDSSRSVYYGLTRVGLGAKNADANQESRNLLLGHQAKADSDPVLEILTNDVIRVSHGATAGPVDQEQLYYLQTRGLTHDDAEALLVRAFVGQVLDRLPDEALRTEVESMIEERLGE